MARPSQAQDQALLQSGRELFADAGCAGLSVRKLAEHAGVNPAMFHYHFKSKELFLRTLLQQIYEQMFESLQLEASHEGPALQRLEQSLLAIGRFLGANRRVIARVWADAQGGEAVALDFMRANAPRHLFLLMGLLDEAERDGAIAAMPGLQRFVFLMSSVLAPILIAGGVANLGVAPAAVAGMLEPQVLSDDALRARIALALKALAPAEPGSRSKGKSHA